MKVCFKYRGKKLQINAKKCNLMSTGLMFRTKNTSTLVFELGKLRNFRIHSWFVFFDFIAVWLDEKGKIINVKLVKPFTFSVSPEKPFKKLIEIPINENNKKIVKLLVGD